MSSNFEFMKMAIAQAKLCQPVDTAYNVGAVLTTKDGQLLSTGYSRELPGNTHAEQCCLMKLAQVPEDAAIYTTMEPCSRRLSGNEPCVSRLLKAKISKVYVGVREPTKFVENCTGIEQLREAGVEVVCMEELEDECRALCQ